MPPALAPPNPQADLLQLAAFIAVMALAITMRHDRRRFWLVMLGGASMIAFFAVFFTWTWPANQATVNWTQMHPDWQQLRRDWEISHMVNAVILLLGFGAVAFAAMDPGHPRRRRISLEGMCHRPRGWR